MNLSRILIKELEEIIPNIPFLLNSSIFKWDSLLIDHKLPIIHRLFLKISDERTILLHKIFNTKGEKAMMHSHSWPFALKVLSGGYEMGIGFSSDRNVEPQVSSTINIITGNTYSFIDSNMWHYTKPYNDGASWSVMLIGERNRERKALNNEPLSEMQIYDMITEFSTCIDYKYKK